MCSRASTRRRPGKYCPHQKNKYGFAFQSFIWRCEYRIWKCKSGLGGPTPELDFGIQDWHVQFLDSELQIWIRASKFWTWACKSRFGYWCANLGFWFLSPGFESPHLIGIQIPISLFWSGCDLPKKAAAFLQQQAVAGPPPPPGRADPEHCSDCSSEFVFGVRCSVLDHLNEVTHFASI